jgi:CheY-like chemotaxis protein
LSAKPNHHQLTILVAEDDQTDFLFLRYLLQNANISLLRVADGEEALSYFNGAGKFRDRSIYPLPDIFIVDLNLPKISGHDVLEWLQLQPEFDGIKRFVLAGSHLASDRSRAQLAGAEHYFIKPLCLGHLALLFEKATGVALRSDSFGSPAKATKSSGDIKSEPRAPLTSAMACCIPSDAAR